jgi:hypothetical protein
MPDRSRAARSIWLPGTWTVEALNHTAVVGAALLVAHAAKGLSELRTSEVDFSLFYRSTRGWLEGRSLYDLAGGLANYNPPQFHLLILPLVLLTLPAAYVAWTLVSGAAAVLTVRTAYREAGESWSSHERGILLAGVLIAAGVGATIHLGQVSWVIALPVTLGWKSARRGDWIACGAWLGLAASLKPFLLLVMVLLAAWRRWGALAAAAATAAVSASIGILVFGAADFVGWLRLLGMRPPSEQVAFFINGSIAAPFARLGLDAALGQSICLAVAIGTIVRARSLTTDRAFLLGLTGSLLASPLGWSYYMPILAGPLFVYAKNRTLDGSAWRAWRLLGSPAISRHFLQSNRALAFTAGSAYTWGLALLWFAAAATENTPASRSPAP